MSSIDSSSITQSQYVQNVNSKSSVAQTSDDDSSTTTASRWSFSDTVEISDEARAMNKMPPPPEAMDFDSMSDEEVVSYVQQMQEATGKVPGMDDDTSLDNLSAEQISSLRNSLSDMAANPPEKTQGPQEGPQGVGGPQGGPPPAPPEEANVEEMSDEELLEYLERMQELTGNSNIPGMAEGTSIDSLTTDNLSTIRTAIQAMSGE